MDTNVSMIDSLNWHYLARLILQHLVPDCLNAHLVQDYVHHPFHCYQSLREFWSGNRPKFAGFLSKYNWSEFSALTVESKQYN